MSQEPRRLQVTGSKREWHVQQWFDDRYMPLWEIIAGPFLTKERARKEMLLLRSLNDAALMNRTKRLRHRSRRLFNE